MNIKIGRPIFYTSILNLLIKVAVFAPIFRSFVLPNKHREFLQIPNIVWVTDLIAWIWDFGDFQQNIILSTGALLMFMNRSINSAFVPTL